jgi:esterase/lipase superfamily enzyme
MRGKSKIFLICGTLALSSGGCTIPRPWLAPKPSAACLGPLQADDALLTLSFRLPDCDSGRPVRWTHYRSEEPQFATTDESLRSSLVSEEDWNAELDRRVARAGKPPVIYIHGYFNNQNDAYRRALGLRALLCPSGTAADRQSIVACTPERPVVTLTWPSHDEFAKYTWDEANAEWAIDRAVPQILAIARRHKGAILIAHSMGNRILVEAAIAAGNEAQLFEHLILAAPDVDRARIAGLLNRQEGLGFPATIYASRKDQALSASWRTHGYPRAGDLSHWVSGRRPGYPFRIFNKAHVVDTTLVSAGAVAHAAFIQSKEGAADLCHVLAGNGAPPGRKPDPQYPPYMVLVPDFQGPDHCSRLSKAAARIAKG